MNQRAVDMDIEDARAFEKEINDNALPCPFCGSRKIHSDPIPAEIDGVPYAELSCGECGGAGPEIRGYLDDWIEGWNTRSGPPEGLSFVFRGFPAPYAIMNNEGELLKVKHRPKDAKPCPFCTSLNLEAMHIDDGWVVQCRNCIAHGPWDFIDDAGTDTQKKATRRWNQRKNSEELSRT